jgi:8-oxo-dGTP pyrophosphatase MutT (NUDIX family)
MRWQLPKGLIDQGETPEEAALREVREEAGIQTVPIEELKRIEYWFFADRGGERTRFTNTYIFFFCDMWPATSMTTIMKLPRHVGLRLKTR